MLARRALLIWLGLALSVQTFAQVDHTLYVRNDSIVSSIGKEIVEATSYIKDADQPSYRAAIRKAFESYWSNKKVKSKLTDKDVAAHQQKVLDLGQQIEETRQNLQVSRASLLDQRRQTDSLNLVAEGAYVAPADDEIEHLRKGIAEDSAELATLNQQLQQLEGVDLKNLQAEVDQARALIDEDNRNLAHNNETLGSYNIDDSPVAQFYNTVNRLQTNIEQLGSVTDKALGDIDVNMLKETMTLLEGSASLLQSVDPGQYKTLKKQVDRLSPMLPAAELLHQGLALMAGKFDDAKNQACAKELEALSKRNLNGQQKKECEAVCTALTRQKYSYMNITSLLEQLKQEDITSSGFDIDNYTSFYLGIVEPDKKEYNPYYKGFREVFGTLVSDFKEGRISEIKDVAQYVDGLKSRL